MSKKQIYIFIFAIAIVVLAMIFLVPSGNDDWVCQDGEVPSGGACIIDENNNMKELKIEIISEGDGDAISSGQTAVVHYEGRLENGQKFDSSLDRGVPFEFLLGSGFVIAGWDQGVVGMKIGEKRKLTIPSHLGYGENEIPGMIPANSTLIFEVELLDIK